MDAYRVLFQDFGDSGSRHTVSHVIFEHRHNERLSTKELCDGMHSEHLHSNADILSDGKYPISYVAVLFFIKKILPYTILEQIKDIAPYMVVSIVMATGIYLINFTAIDIRLQLVIQIIFGIVSYIGGCYLLKSRILLEMIQNIRQKL